MLNRGSGESRLGVGTLLLRHNSWMFVMINAKKLAQKQKSKEYIAAQRREMLEQFGYSELKKKHKKSRRPDFPNLKVESRVGLSNAVGNGFVKPSAAHHPDAKLFPIQNVHKSGFSLLTKADDLKYASGKKS